MRILFDTSAVLGVIRKEYPRMEELIEMLKALVEKGKIEVSYTHIVEDEIKYPSQKTEFREIFPKMLRAKELPTRGLIWGHIKWGKARWADECTHLIYEKCIRPEDTKDDGEEETARGP